MVSAESLQKALAALAAILPGVVMADEYTATTMRLLRYEGSVEIQDASGAPRTAMENMRFDSGESMRTGAASSASIGLGAARSSRWTRTAAWSLSKIPRRSP